MLTNSVIGLCLTVLVPYVTTYQTTLDGSFRSEKFNHTAKELSRQEISRLVSLTNITHIDEALDNICVVRVVGTPGHARVKEYLKGSMKDLGWTVESDEFEEKIPDGSKLKFENIIAKLNPHAKRYLTLACHYDSKFIRGEDFVGATDSAVPCAQLLNLATVMRTQLESAKTSDVSLMFIFFDGEEAFVEWNNKDSIYGARHLAKKWHNVVLTHGSEQDLTHLDKIDIFVLLDLLGAPDPQFVSYFSNTYQWYRKLVWAEETLANMTAFQGYSYGKQIYFHNFTYRAQIEDDHIPFLRRNVPILHLIPFEFPPFWHKAGDNRSIVDLDTTENLNKILRVFVASYLNLEV